MLTQVLLRCVCVGSFIASANICQAPLLCQPLCSGVPPSHRFQGNNREQRLAYGAGAGTGVGTAWDPQGSKESWGAFIFEVMGAWAFAIPWRGPLPASSAHLSPFPSRLPSASWLLPQGPLLISHDVGIIQPSPALCSCALSSVSQPRLTF